MPSYILNYIFDGVASIWGWMSTHYIYYSEELSVTYAAFAIGCIIFALAVNFLVPWSNQLDDEMED